jgi:hypothetical protein
MEFCFGMNLIRFGEIILYCKLVLLIKSSFLQFGKKYGRPFCKLKIYHFQ